MEWCEGMVGLGSSRLAHGALHQARTWSGHWMDNPPEGFGQLVEGTYDADFGKAHPRLYGRRTIRTTVDDLRPTHVMMSATDKPRSDGARQRRRSSKPGQFLRSAALVPLLAERVPWFSELLKLYRSPTFAVSHLVELGMIPERFMEIRTYNSVHHFYFHAERIPELIAWLNTQPRRYGARELPVLLAQREVGVEIHEQDFSRWLAHQIAGGVFENIGLSPTGGIPARGFSQEQATTIVERYCSSPPVKHRSRGAGVDGILPAKALTVKGAAFELKRRHPHWPQRGDVYLIDLLELARAGSPLFPPGSVIKSPHSGVWYFLKPALV